MVGNMSSKQKWRINVKNMATQLRVGCTPDEHEPQRIFVNAVVDALSHLGVKHIDMPITPWKVWNILKEKGITG